MMRSINPKNVLILVLMFIAVIEFGMLLSKFFFGTFDLQFVAPKKDFEYKDNLRCQVVYSTFEDFGESTFQYLNESTFKLSELDSEAPQLEFYGNISPIKKAYENKEMVILQTEPGNFFFQTIQIAKEGGTFVRTFMNIGQYFGVGEIFHPESFHYVVAQKGWCE